MKLNELDLNKLHVFRVVAESTSMREAGARLLRTPSAISQSVTSLEKSLGVQLFVRTGIRLELTEPGQLLLRQVKSGEDSLNATLDTLRAAPARVRGRVSLGLPPGYPAVSLAAPLSAALLKFPELQLRLRFLPHAELAEALHAGQVEMALSLQPLRFWQRRIKSAKLREETLILAVPGRYRYLCSGTFPADLPVVDYYQKPLLIEAWLKHHKLGRTQPKVRAYGETLDHVLQLVLHGVGCAVIPRHVIEDAIATGTLLEHPLDRRKPLRVSVWMNAMNPREKMPLASRSIRDALEISP
jgi:DNA-binding transcriptional LysR family regulator